MQVKLSIILLVAFCALLGATGQIFFKLASKTLNFEIVSLLTNWKLFLGLFFYGIATILFVFALKQGNLSILYPIIATSYIWVTIFSMIFLKETFPFYKWFGVLLIIFAVGIITK
jgi:drug/metabolite transporter (DMT)-like permease